MRERDRGASGSTGSERSSVAPGVDEPCSIRKAIVGDVETIQKLVNHFASEGLMLALSLSEVYEHLRDFTVAHREDEVLGACSLHIIWEDLAEIRSLVVDPACRESGIGRALVESCLEEARELRLQRVFALTYKENFFHRMGFRTVEKEELPHKVWTDCLKCTKFPNCDETAVVKDLTG
jgi:amino-acid N-acetyltransferase